MTHDPIPAIQRRLDNLIEMSEIRKNTEEDIEFYEGKVAAYRHALEIVRSEVEALRRLGI